MSLKNFVLSLTFFVSFNAFSASKDLTIVCAKAAKRRLLPPAAITLLCAGTDSAVSNLECFDRATDFLTSIQDETYDRRIIPFDAAILCSKVNLNTPFSGKSADHSSSNSLETLEIDLFSSEIMNDILPDLNDHLASSSSNVVFPVSCLSIVRDFGLSIRDSVLLCSGATSVGPIDCATAARTTFNIRPEYIPLICSGTRHDAYLAPFECYDTAASSQSISYSDDNLLFLCAGARSNAPISCAREAIQQNLPYGAMLCTKAVNGIGPINCFKQARQEQELIHMLELDNSSLDENLAFLCSGAESNEPIECVKDALKEFPHQSSAFILGLCTHFPSFELAARQKRQLTPYSSSGSLSSLGQTP